MSGRDADDRIGWLFDRAAKAWPDQEFVVFRDERWTFGKLARWVDTICVDLLERGVQRGDRLMVHVPNCMEALAVKLAAFRIGVVVSPVIPIYRAHELRHILADLRPTAVVVSATLGDRHPAEEIDDTLTALGLDAVVRYVVGGTRQGWTPVPPPASGTEPTNLPEPLDPDDCCLILYTSGTSALPKGAMLSSRAVLAQAEVWRRSLALQPGATVMCVAPLAHLGGFVSGYLLPASIGARTVLMPSWDPDTAVRLIDRERVEFSVGAVTFLLDLVNRYEADPTIGHRIRTFLCGGTACPPDLVGRAEGLGIKAFRAYGMTEAGTCTFADPDDPLDRRANFDGRVNAGTEIEAVDHERRPLARGEQGELRIRGAQRMIGYTDPDQTAAHTDDDGWFYSGDVGIVDTDGWLTVRGRLKDIINRGGEKFSAADIESALCTHPSVDQAAVVGVPDPRYGEAVAAFLVLRPGATWHGPDELIRHLHAAALAKQKVPVEWHVLDALPLTGSGKVQKQKLLDGRAGGTPAGKTDVVKLVRTYDHYDHDFALDPHETYTTLRRQCPVGRSDLYGGFYVLTRHEDVTRAYQEPDIFSSFPADTPPKPHNRKLIPFEIDPPEHVEYRRLANPLFSPRPMRALEQSLREQACSLVDTMVARGEVDFIEAFALPFPSAAFLNLVGLPADVELRDQLFHWTNMILHFTGAEDGTESEKEAVRAEGVSRLWSFIESIVDERLRSPGEDVVSGLVKGSYAGERALSRFEVISFTYVLVLGGLDTVTAALGFSFWHLGRRPDLRRQIVEDPSIIPAAAEEFLRYESGVHPSRTVVRDCTLSGVDLAAGTRVVLPIASANRDEDVFDNPHEIDFRRSNVKSLAFGAGNHRCIGVHLARLELRVAFEEIFSRIPDFEIPDGAVLDAEGGGTRGLTTLPFQILATSPQPTTSGRTQAHG